MKKTNTIHYLFVFYWPVTRYSWLPITRTLADSKQNRFLLDFLKGSSYLLWKQENFNPFMFKEKFYESMNKLEIYKDCVENHSSVTRWHYFFSPYKSFQFFPKTNCFRVRRKLITYETNYRKRPNHFLMSSSYFHSLSLSYSLTPLPPVLSVQTATNLVE